MHRYTVKRLPVVDTDGQLAGITGQFGSRSVVLRLTGVIRHMEGAVGVRDRVRYPAESPAENAES